MKSEPTSIKSYRGVFLWILLVIGMYVPAGILADFLVNLGPDNQFDWSGLYSPFVVEMLSVILVIFIVAFSYISAGNATVEATMSQEGITFRSHLKTGTYLWPSLLSIEPTYFLGQAAINVIPIAGTLRKREVVSPIMLRAILAYPACPKSLAVRRTTLNHDRTGDVPVLGVKPSPELSSNHRLAMRQFRSGMWFAWLFGAGAVAYGLLYSVDGVAILGAVLFVGGFAAWFGYRRVSAGT